jgi:hypothetical protein
MKKRFFVSSIALIWLSAFVCYSDVSADVTIPYLIRASTTVANYMEEYRKLPESVWVGTENVNSAQFLYLLATSIRDIYQNIDANSYPIPQCIDPFNPYPTIELNDAFYRSPLSQGLYMDFISTIISSLNSHPQAPDYFTFNEANIRYCSAVHYLSSILRFYDFFGFLPNSVEMKMISPRNLVSADWNTPEDLRAYISGITFHSNYSDNVYYRHNVIDYSTFKLAREIVGDFSLYPALESIYNWVNVDTWRRWGYAQTPYTPFGVTGLWSAREAWSMRLSTSGSHDVKMNALYRALGIPAYFYYVYYIPEERWINTDVHSPFGSDPYLDPSSNMYNGFEDSPLPSVSRDFINEIRFFVNYESSVQNQDPGLRGLFINASDITTYGVDRIVSAAKKGGFNAIILTVKTPYGDVYADQDVSFPAEYSEPIWIGGGGAGQLCNPIHTVALDPLFLAAHAEGIQVHLAFNILSDYLMGRKQNNAHPDQNPNWSQWDGSPSSQGYVTGMICPCVSEYREIMRSILEKYLVRYPVDGVVIMDLRWFLGRIYGEPAMGNNPRCDPHKTSPDWYERILVGYLENLVTTIRSIKGDCYISFLSSSLGRGNSGEGASSIPTKYCGQDFEQLSQRVDNFILNIAGYYWLTSNLFDETDAFSYDFVKLFHHLQSQTTTPISIAFNLRDEWEYPSQFFNGLYNYDLDIGSKGFHLYSMISGWGEWGPAFTESQWDKVQYIALTQQKKKYLPDQTNDFQANKSRGCGGGTNSLFQSFTPSLSPLGAIDLRLRAGGEFPDKGYNTTIIIRSGTPDGSLLGTKTVFVPGPQALGAQLEVRFEFPLPIQLVPGNTYVIEWISPPEGDGVLTWMVAEGNPYTGGTAFGCTKISIVGEDFLVRTYAPLDALVDTILKFFDISVREGTLVGDGKGESARGRLKALRNMLNTAGDFIARDDFDGACNQLRDAYNRTDGLPKPPDFVKGTAAPDLAKRIESLRAGLKCK